VISFLAPRATLVVFEFRASYRAEEPNEVMATDVETKISETKSGEEPKLREASIQAEERADASDRAFIKLTPSR
jgi:hypothetical protein